jgi:hypothetical protein
MISIRISPFDFQNLILIIQIGILHNLFNKFCHTSMLKSNKCNSLSNNNININYNSKLSKMVKELLINIFQIESIIDTSRNPCLIISNI